jgi:hypothetical protein
MYYLRQEFLYVNKYKMDKIIQHNFKKAFSDSDMRRICKDQVNVITYRELREYKRIDDALGDYGAMILLYETKPLYGHWTAVHKVDGKTIEFFDSYGIKPDGQIKEVHPRFRKELGYDRPYLTELCMQDGYHIIYNDIKLQKLKDDMSTCGRWCGLRIACRQIPLDAFVKLFLNQKMQPDWYVTAMTMYI